jgi:hypothetical protein
MPRTVDLPHVRAFVDSKSDDPREDGSVEREQPEVDRVRDQREPEEQVCAEVDEEDLDDDRGAAEDEHVAPETSRSTLRRDIRISAAISPRQTPISCAATEM